MHHMHIDRSEVLGTLDRKDGGADWREKRLDGSVEEDRGDLGVEGCEGRPVDDNQCWHWLMIFNWYIMRRRCQRW